MSLTRSLLALLPLLLVFEHFSFADYYSNYYSNYSWARPASNPIISLTLDPQESLNSAFRIAAREGRREDMLRFLSQKADINGRSDEGETALMYAARNCSLEIVETLLSKGADVGAEDKRGRTALIYASQDSCVPVIEAFLRTGKVHVGHRDKSGRGAVDYARDGAALDVAGAPIDAIQILCSVGSERAGC